MNKLALGLSPEQVAKRRFSIGASDAVAIMQGGEKLWKLWEQKTGRREPDDLSGVLPVQLGSFTEAFNRFWYEKQTGRTVTDAGVEHAHPDTPWLTCTLDGRVELSSGPAVWEGKHVGGREPLDVVTQRYMPQLHHQMHVCGCDWAVLSVLIGTDRYEYIETELDPFYLAEILEREEAFWRCVQGDIPPPDMPGIQAPVPPEKWRTVDLTGNNAWASFAADWLGSKTAANTFKKAEKELKALVEADVGFASGHGIECKRDKAGRLGIKEMK